MTIDERDWRLQELALREEMHGGAASTVTGAEHMAYRVVIKAIRSQPLASLPSDFAAQIARKVEQNRHRDDLLEYRLLWVLLASMALLSLWVLVGLVAYLRTLPGPVATSALLWTLTIGACFGLTKLPMFFATRKSLAPISTSSG